MKKNIFGIEIGRNHQYAVVSMLLFFIVLTSAAQELKVKSFAPLPTDLTARKQPRQDLNGRQCALLKVMVMDDITDCGNSNIGDVASNGLIKLVYVPSVAKSLTLNFKYHYPLTVVFADYGVSRLDGGTTYELRIVDALQMMVESGKVNNTVTQEIRPETSSQDEAASGNNETTGKADDNWRQLFVDAEKSQDYKKAFSICKQAAEAGNAEAQRNLGYYYAEGKGCKADPKKAFDWYQKAVDNGDGGAAFSLGNYFADGKGITVKDEATAFKYYKISADLGNKYGMASLAYCYDTGIGTMKDRRKAADIYMVLADDETYEYSASSAYSAGLHYYLPDKYGMGKGWKPDYVEAMKWFRKSAEQNYPEALEIIGECYVNGYGVDKNGEEGIRWFRKAADLGNIDSMWRLGRCYETGTILEKNVENAVYWYKKGISTDGNSANCKEALKRLGY